MGLWAARRRPCRKLDANLRIAAWLSLTCEALTVLVWRSWPPYGQLHAKDPRGGGSGGVSKRNLADMGDDDEVDGAGLSADFMRSRIQRMQDAERGVGEVG